MASRCSCKVAGLACTENKFCTLFADLFCSEEEEEEEEEEEDIAEEKEGREESTPAATTPL
jgi:hypothetical protein